jgi:hypothetical protein
MQFLGQPVFPCRGSAGHSVPLQRRTRDRRLVQEAVDFFSPLPLARFGVRRNLLLRA